MENRLSRSDFDMMRTFIRKQSGIHLGDDRVDFLENKLAYRMNATGMTSVKEYHFFLHYDPDREKEAGKLIDTVTNNETYFFREDDQLKDFTEDIAPNLLQNRQNGSPVRIWSAGCATGEEPYTLAMMLIDQITRNAGSAVQLYASDINGRVLAMAESGVFDQYSLRYTPFEFKQKYFRQNGNEDTFVIDKQIKALIRFVRFNLLDDVITAPFKDMDAVFCRNVIIYFDDEMKKKCMKNIYRAMKPGGHLFLGHSESLSRVTNLFDVVRLKRTIAYRKPA